MTDKEKFRKEVERLKSQLLRGACSSQIAMETRCKEEAYNEVLAILDTMQEAPVSEKKCMFTKDSYTDEDRKVLCEDCKEKCEYNKKEEPVSEDLEKENKIEILADIIFNAAKYGYMPYDTQDEYCAMEIAKENIDKFIVPKKQEETVSEDKMTISKEWFEHCKKSWYNEGYIDGKYNRDRQFEESVSENLEKIVEEITEPTILNAYGTKELARRLLNTIYGTSISDDLGEYINELSKQFPEVSFAKLSRIAVRVAKWQKKQMMAKAVDGYVIEDVEEGNGDFLLSADYLSKSIGLKDQQKVKVIVIKEG